MVEERANSQQSYHRRRAAQQQLGRDESVQTLTPVSAQNHTHSHETQEASRPPPPLSRYSNTCVIQSQKTKKHKREPQDSLWLLFLILSSLAPDKSLYPPTIDRKLTMDTQNLRTLFDPMVGEFCADTSPEVLNKFFNSKMRWRDDNAWFPKTKIRANMMLTEQPPLIRTTSTTNVPSAVTNNSQPSVAEPSIVDYDAIDIYWREDIEMAKGIPVYPMQYRNSNTGQGCSTSSQMCSGSDHSEQFERDLQLLTEKSLFTQLTNDEHNRYENLSKSHYVDFYRNVVPTAVAKHWQSTTNSSSTSGYSNDTNQFRAPSPTKSNISSFDENEAATFFSNLAKQSMLEDTRPSTTQMAPQQLQTYSNLTLCADQSNVLNNVSLAQQTMPYTNDTFFMPNTNGIRGRGLEVEPTQESDSIAEDILSGIIDQPLEISEAESNALWSTMQNSEDLNDAAQLHEFESMEMLGEFQHNDTIDKRVDSPIPENILTLVERETSPSSGIGSMQSSSSSPTHNEDFGLSENDEHSYRVYEKLAPKIRNQHNSFSTDDPAESFKRLQSSNYQRKQSKSRNVSESGTQRKRGRQSKDEQLAQDHNLPCSAEEFAAMSHMQIQGYLRDAKLTPLQKSLIKKIRRRGRNKVAARKCRERRTYPGSVYGQQDDDYIKEEMESNFDPSDLSLYDF